MRNPRKSPALTERQIAWCRENIKSFAEAWKTVQKAAAHRRKVYQDLGAEPDALPCHAASIYGDPAVSNTDAPEDTESLRRRANRLRDVVRGVGDAKAVAEIERYIDELEAQVGVLTRDHV